MEDRIYYAVINHDGVCIGLLDTYVPHDSSEYVAIGSYDFSLVLRKMWNGVIWIDNPDYIIGE